MLYPVAQHTVGGSGKAMMHNSEFREAVALPTQHIGFYFINAVPARSLQ